MTQTPPSQIVLIFDFGYVDKQLHIPNCRKQSDSVLINFYFVIVGVIYERNTLKELISLSSKTYVLEDKLTKLSVSQID